MNPGVITKEEGEGGGYVRGGGVTLRQCSFWHERGDGWRNGGWDLLEGPGGEVGVAHRHWDRRRVDEFHREQYLRHKGAKHPSCTGGCWAICHLWQTKSKCSNLKFLRNFWSALHQLRLYQNREARVLFNSLFAKKENKIPITKKHTWNAPRMKCLQPCTKKQRPNLRVFLCEEICFVFDKVCVYKKENHVV